MDGPVLTDGVLELRPLAVTDAAEHFAGEDDDAIRWLADAAVDVDVVEAWIVRNRVSLATGGPVLNLGIREAATDRLVGNIESNLAEPSLFPGEANLAYGIFPAWRGRGYARAAIDLLCAHLTGLEPGPHTAVIRVAEENARSVAVAEGAGFRPDGTCRAGDGSPLQRYVRPLRAGGAGPARGADRNLF